MAKNHHRTVLQSACIVRTEHVVGRFGHHAITKPRIDDMESIEINFWEQTAQRWLSQHTHLNKNPAHKQELKVESAYVRVTPQKVPLLADDDDWEFNKEDLMKLLNLRKKGRIE